LISFAEPHQVDAAPRKCFDAAPAPTLLNIKPTFLKQAKTNIIDSAFFPPDFFGFKMV
jgi:hypothetical protein